MDKTSTLSSHDYGAWTRTSPYNLHHSTSPFAFPDPHSRPQTSLLLSAVSGVSSSSLFGYMRPDFVSSETHSPRLGASPVEEGGLRFTRKRTLSWADIISPGSARFDLPARLMSPPVFKKAPTDALELKRKQEKAQELRDSLLVDKTARLRSKAERAQARKMVLLEQQKILRESIEEKQAKAEKLRELFLKSIQDKAKEESQKLDEIAYISAQNIENRKIEVAQRHLDSEARRQEIEEERQRKLSGTAALQEAANGRRKQQEAERLAKLARDEGKKREMEARRERERRENLERKVAVREEKMRRMAEMKSLKMAEEEEMRRELHAKLRTKLERGSHRHTLLIQAKQAKAAAANQNARAVARMAQIARRTPELFGRSFGEEVACGEEEEEGGREGRESTLQKSTHILLLSCASEANKEHLLISPDALALDVSELLVRLLVGLSGVEGANHEGMILTASVLDLVRILVRFEEGVGGEVERGKEDVVSYLLCIDVMDKIRDVFMSVHGPLTEAQLPIIIFLQRCLAFVEAICVVRRPDSTPITTPQRDPMSLAVVAAMRKCDFLDVLVTLMAALVLSTARTKDGGGGGAAGGGGLSFGGGGGETGVSEGVVEVSLGAFRVFNLVCGLDLRMVQSVLASETIQFQFFHLAVFWIQTWTSWTRDNISKAPTPPPPTSESTTTPSTPPFPRHTHLLHELLLLLGHACLDSPSNQSILRFVTGPPNETSSGAEGGGGATVLIQMIVTALPFRYFCLPALREVVFLTIAVGCDGDAGNVAVVNEEMDLGMVVGWLRGLLLVCREEGVGGGGEVAVAAEGGGGAGMEADGRRRRMAGEEEEDMMVDVGDDGEDAMEVGRMAMVRRVRAERRLPVERWEEVASALEQAMGSGVER
ncbi:hypothetical protein HDU67_001036 [Dinochytrium kinnereticum]|nr:hypothetical protein HDU67_001036 [Dinochytrium kinnereticum]